MRSSFWTDLVRASLTAIKIKGLRGSPCGTPEWSSMVLLRYPFT